MPLLFSEAAIRFLICDRDSKYTGPLDEVFRSERIRILRTHRCGHRERTPSLSASSAPFAPSTANGCWILNQQHLERVLRIYLNHYNRERPYRPVGMRPPDPIAARPE